MGEVFGLFPLSHHRFSSSAVRSERWMAEYGASDMYISGGEPSMMLINGALQTMSEHVKQLL